MSKREEAFLILDTTFAAISGVVTAVRKPFTDFDLKDYTQAQLPLIHIEPPPPNLTIENGMRIYERDEFKTHLYYIDWNSSASTMESWIEKIIEGMNYSPTASASCDFQRTPTDIVVIDYPLVQIDFRYILHVHSSTDSY